jgi:hypothetical protein
MKPLNEQESLNVRFWPQADVEWARLDCPYPVDAVGPVCGWSLIEVLGRLEGAIVEQFTHRTDIFVSRELWGVCS